MGKACITSVRKQRAIRRLKAIEGQAKGLQRMIEEDRNCLDILTQISSTHEALRSVGKILMQNYLEVCATNAIRSKNKEKQDAIYSELMDIIYKYVK